MNKTQKMQIIMYKYAYLLFGFYFFLMLHRGNIKPYGDNALLWYGFVVNLIIFSYFIFINGTAFGIRTTLNNIDQIKKDFIQEIDSNKEI